VNKVVKSLIRNKEIKNAGWIIAEQIFQMAVSLVVGVLTARYLGPSNYGALNYTASFVTFALSVATLGMEGVVIKKMIMSPDDEGVYLGSCMLFRFISSILSSIAIFVIVAVLNPDDRLKWILVFLQSFQLIFKSVQILDSWFQRHLKSRYVSIGKMVACLIVAGYKIFLLATQKDIVWFALSNSLTDIVVALMLYIFYRTEHGQNLKVSKKKGMEVLSESYHFILSGLMSATYSQMDRIMIGSMMTDVDVGLYTTATAICGMWLFVPNAIINSFRPKILELKKQGNEESYRRRLEQLYSSIIWLCIFASVVICILGNFVIRILYGDDYIGAVSALRIAIWYETFAMIGTARGIWILCENKNKYVKYYLGIGAVVNLILNYVMIPVWGINGAAVATLITQIITSMIAPLLFKETRYHTLIVLRAFVGCWFFENRRINK
jgi:O-antigen/teichoic acid export membrane protein